MKHIEEILQIIDNHRTEAVFLCPEDCWCWDIDAAISKYKEKLSQENTLEPGVQNKNNSEIAVNKRLVELIEEEFKSIIETKTGWGKLQILQAHSRAIAQALYKFAAGEQPITHNIATMLEFLTGVPAKMWCNLEANYIEQLAKLKEVKNEF